MGLAYVTLAWTTVNLKTLRIGFKWLCTWFHKIKNHFLQMNYPVFKDGYHAANIFNRRWKVVRRN